MASWINCGFEKESSTGQDEDFSWFWGILEPNGILVTNGFPCYQNGFPCYQNGMISDRYLIDSDRYSSWLPLLCVLAGKVSRSDGIGWAPCRKPRHATWHSGTHRSIVGSAPGYHGRTDGEFWTRWGKLSKVGKCVIHVPETVLDVTFKIF